MPRITINGIRNNGNEATRFFTGFTWDEIEIIHKTLKKVHATGRNSSNDDDDTRECPESWGLPLNIYNRLTTDQADYLVDYLVEDWWPRFTVKQTAHLLAKGNSYRG